MSAIQTEAASLGGAAPPENARRLMRQLAGYVPVNLAQVIASFGAIYLFTRILGAESYGRYALILSAVNFLFLFGFTWIEAAAHRFYAPMAAQGRSADLIASLRWLLMAALPLVALGSIAVITLTPMEPLARLAAGIAALYLIVRGCVRVGVETHRAAQRVISFSLIEALQISLGFLIGAVLAVTTGLKEAAPFVGLLAAALVTLAIDWPRHSKDAKGGKVDHAAAKNYAAFGWSIVIIVMIEQLLAFTDRFLIAGFLGEAEAGAYAAAFGLAPRILDILFVWTGRTAAPLNTSVYETQGPEAAQALAKKYFATLLALTLPAAVGISLVAKPLAEIMVAPEMAAQVAMLIPWLTVSGFLAGYVTYYFGESFRLSRKMSLCSTLLAISSLTNIGLNIVLLPRLGLLGAAIASVVGFGLATILLAVLSKKALHFPIPWPEAGKTFLAAGVMGAAVYFLPSWGGVPELALKASVGGIIYAIGALLFDIGGARGLAARLTPKASRPAPVSTATAPVAPNDGTNSDGRA
ncbi:MAG: lipopolysaccharide biosynthesis protein [Caulobacterales bacterium]